MKPMFWESLDHFIGFVKQNMPFYNFGRFGDQWRFEGAVSQGSSSAIWIACETWKFSNSSQKATDIC